MAIQDFKVGQELWYVPKAPYYGDPRLEKVTKVGRKWLYIGEGYAQHKVDVERLSVHSLNGQHYYGYCFKSREVYELRTLIQNEWSKFKRHLDSKYIAPEKLSLADILHMQTLLGMIPEKFERAPVAERVTKKPEGWDQ